MKRKILSLMLAAALVLGLAVPALAAGQTFSDVPSSYWGYADIEAVAEAGLMNGTGGGAFSPEMKVSVAQFLTLLGRLVFPNVKADGADWYGPYVTAAKDAGLLTGTQVDTSNVEAEISRYDMAVILRAAAKKLGVAEKVAQSSEVKDYLDIPTRYADSVLAVYGMGLIRGDQAGNFNGSNTMMRAEVATVIMRLAKAKPGGTTTEPDPEKPTDATYTLEVQTNFQIEDTLVLGEQAKVSCRVLPSYEAAPYGYGEYGEKDGFACTSSNPAVVEITEPLSDGWFLTAKSMGSAIITITDPYGVSGSKVLNVVTAREGLELKTYAVSVTSAQQERHTLQGNAYTETDFIDNVPYKIYYTRDGGKTSQVVYEGVSPNGGGGLDRIEIELPEDAFYSQDAGLYISGETTLNGQRLVTSDLRTDGRAYAKIVGNISESQSMLSRLEFLLTPPAGEKARFTIKGAVKTGPEIGARVGEGFTVQLHLKDGRIVAEAKTDSDGNYTLNCEVDALDNGFNVNIEQYYVTASGVQNGIRMEDDGKGSNGDLVLRSMDFMGANPYSRQYKNVLWYVYVEACTPN